jgi:hypothetical protein
MDMNLRRGVELFRLVGKHAIWTQVDTVQMDWQTYHTQGLVKIGDLLRVGRRGR